MTTVSIDDDLGRQVGQLAAAQGKSLDQFVHEVLRRTVDAGGVSISMRNGIPVIHVDPPVRIDPDAIKRELEEHGF
jgi:hypothetical protein